MRFCALAFSPFVDVFRQNEFKVLSELHWPPYAIGSLSEDQLAEVLELTGRLPLLLHSFVTTWHEVCIFCWVMVVRSV